jgi:hypothetical protein
MATSVIFELTKQEAAAAMKDTTVSSIFNHCGAASGPRSPASMGCSSPAMLRRGYAIVALFIVSRPISFLIYRAEGYYRLGAQG